MVKRQTDETTEILATGEATMSQIAQMFETDAKTLPKRLKGIIPRGKRNGYKVYSIREAAGRLVRPGYEIEEFIRQMSPQELPPLLSKEFWNGQNARLKHEKELGNLWPTEDVIEAIAVVEQGIRMTILLVTDDIEREEGLTDGQRKVFRRITDAAIGTMKEKITELFEKYYASRTDNRAERRARRIQRRLERLAREDRDSGRLLETEDDEEVSI